jgi:N-methylhydantoinase A
VVSIGRGNVTPVAGAARDVRRAFRGVNAAIVAVDTGGTFTDVVALADGGCSVLKVPSTPDDPARAVLDGREAAAGGRRALHLLVHGSTVATNALLERRGARVALVTNARLRGRARDRPAEPAAALRAGRDGGRRRSCPRRPRTASPAGWAATARSSSRSTRRSSPLAAGAGERRRAIAVCCCTATRTRARAPRSRAPRWRWGCRSPCRASCCPSTASTSGTATTVVNAYVAPLMDRYLARIEAGRRRRVRIMGSNGGALPSRAPGASPVHTILSGPAGGVVGALTWARGGHGIERHLTFDMGGTSTDVSLCPGAAAAHARVLDRRRARGAAGARHPHGRRRRRLDRAWTPGGALRVGPESAGAVPGPICYGRGGTERDRHRRQRLAGPAAGRRHAAAGSPRRRRGRRTAAARWPSTASASRRRPRPRASSPSSTRPWRARCA